MPTPQQMPPLSGCPLHTANDSLLFGSKPKPHSRQRNQLYFFSPFRTVLFASGMDHLLDNIPHAMAVTIRKEMYSLMGRNMYYRIRNKERLLHPDEQKQIAAIFSKHGIKFKPAFDKYIEKYDW